MSAAERRIAELERLLREAVDARESSNLANSMSALVWNNTVTSNTARIAKIEADNGELARLLTDIRQELVITHNKNEALISQLVRFVTLTEDDARVIGTLRAAATLHASEVRELDRLCRHLREKADECAHRHKDIPGVMELTPEEKRRFDESEVAKAERQMARRLEQLRKHTEVEIANQHRVNSERIARLTEKYGIDLLAPP